MGLKELGKNQRTSFGPCVRSGQITFNQFCTCCRRYKPLAAVLLLNSSDTFCSFCSPCLCSYADFLGISVAELSLAHVSRFDDWLTWRRQHLGVEVEKK